MAADKIANYKIDDISEGMGYCFTKTITARDVECFAEISGDRSLLHMSDSFAHERGFQGRVVHGALLAGYISQMIGMYLPGENCLLQSLSIKFHAPCFIDDTVEIKARVDQVSHGTNAMVLEVLVNNEATHSNLAKAKVHIAFLNEKR